MFNLTRDEKPGTVQLPHDATTSLPVEAAGWLRKYGITASEVARYKMLWSPEQQLLIFPIYGENETLLAWQARNFRLKKVPLEKGEGTLSQLEKGYRTERDGPKYLTKGSLSDIINVFETRDTTDPNLLIATEGVLDALKVSRVYSAMPLYGTHLSTSSMKRIADRFDRLGIWLDPDKKTESVKMALRASQFIPSFVILTSLDPKDYDEVSIKSIVSYQETDPVTPSNLT